MKNKNLLSKILAIAAAALLLLPILFMLFTGIAGSIMSKEWRMDYMLPAELFPFVLAGIAALLWACIRERYLIKPIAWTVGAGLFLVVGCQLFAVVTGLASGRVETPGLIAVVIAALIGYDLCVALLGYFAIRLTIHTFSKKADDREPVS
jgi:hypothetical protein